MEKYNMTFEEAQEYISKRDFDIAWNDCDVFIDERYITQTVGNVLKWADNNPKWKPSEEQMTALLVTIGDEKKIGSDVAKVIKKLYYELKAL